jgi:Fe(3+) dicitrate transport protein
LGSSKVSINNILTNPTTYNAEYRAISGADNTIDNALLVKANNRKYEAKGIQSVGYSFETKAKHDIDFGIRYHEDYEDRFQWIDGTQYKTG